MTGNQMLDGVTVLEAGVYVTAPKPARILAEFGAEVVKVERPTGAPWRVDGEDEGTGAGYVSLFAQMDRGKKSLSIDLRSEEGAEVFKELAAEADVIVQNMAPGAMEAFGLAYEDIKEVNEDIVYCSISGYGQTGPMAGKNAVDFMAQGMSGLPYQNGMNAKDGQPHLSGWFAVDETTALTATISILGALLGGEGTHIDVSLFDSILGAMEAKAASYAVGQPIRPPASMDRYMGPIGMYETADGYVTIWVLPPTPENWLALWATLGFDDWVEEEKFVDNEVIAESEETIEPRVVERFKEEPRDYWADRLDEAGVVSAPVLRTEEAFEHEQLDDRDVASVVSTETMEEYFMLNFPAMYSNYETGAREPISGLGEHNEEVLADAGFSAEEIQRLYDEGVVHTRDD